jgi:type III restriction enzyme
VDSYVKNQGLGFTIPYVLDGKQRSYLPDFIVRLDDGHGSDDLLNLVIEVSGATARNRWVPAVNNHAGYGRWAFIEVTDPWEAAGMIDAVVTGAVA